MRRRLLFIVVLPLAAVAAISALAIGLMQTIGVDVATLVDAVARSNQTADRLQAVVPVLRFPLQLVFALLVFFLAWLVSRASWRLAGLALRLADYNGDGSPPASEPADLSEASEPAAVVSHVSQRRNTVRQLVASLITILAFSVAAVLALSQFVSLTNLAIIVTVGANALGFAARDYVGDFLNGISNIFEDRFTVGENVSVFRVSDTVEGVVERVTVRTLSLRTRTGELIVVPQGEVRILRNYSRGSFSGTTVTCRVPPAALPATMALLRELGEEAPDLVPGLREPWTVMSREGTLDAAPELVIDLRADYGKGAEVRLRVMALIERRLSAAGIPLSG